MVWRLTDRSGSPSPWAGSPNSSRSAATRRKSARAEERGAGAWGPPFPVRLFRPDNAVTGIPDVSDTLGMPSIISIIGAHSLALGKGDPSAFDEVSLPMPITQKRPGPLHVPA